MDDTPSPTTLPLSEETPLEPMDALLLEVKSLRVEVDALKDVLAVVREAALEVPLMEALRGALLAVEVPS